MSAGERISSDKIAVLEQLRKTPIVEIACSKTAIGRSTYYRWRKDDAQFASDADEAIRDGLLLMNDVAEGYLVSAIKDRNMSAISLWLKTHHPTYAPRLQINGTMTKADEELSPEQRKVVEQALALSLTVKAENISMLNGEDGK